MNSPITRDVFDTRDLIEYKEHLESEILSEYQSWAENHNEGKDEEQEELEIPYDFEDIEFIDEEAFTSTCNELIEEYESIKEFCDELENYCSDFTYGESVIHEDYFEEYVEEFCRDVGFLPNDIPAFLENNINWEGVADDLKIDYAEVEYRGETYYIR